MERYELEIINHTRDAIEYFEIMAWNRADAARFAVLAHDGYNDWDITNDDITVTVW